MVSWLFHLVSPTSQGSPGVSPPASKRRDEPRRGPLKALRSRLVQPTELRLVPARRPGARHVGEPLG